MESRSATTMSLESFLNCFPNTIRCRGLVLRTAAIKPIRRFSNCHRGNSRANKKGRPGGGLFDVISLDQAASSAGFGFRRYAMKPIPAKPTNIMAQVEGSGTLAMLNVPLPASSPMV